MTFAFKYMDEDTENDGNGQKSMVKAFLSLEIWQPLGKLTYVMYLIHFTLVFPWWLKDKESPTYYSEWNELLLIIGIWAIVASIGLVLWFVMERPMANLVTLFLKWMVGGGGGKRENKKKEALLANEEYVHGPPRPVMSTSVNSMNIPNVPDDLIDAVATDMTASDKH